MGKLAKLSSRGIVTSFIRNRAFTKHHTSIIKLEGVNTKKDTQFYLGKRLVYLYKAKKADAKGSKFRALWGKVTRPHGSNGAVRAKFITNLPGQALGREVRVMLFPSNI